MKFSDIEVGQEFEMVEAPVYRWKKVSATHGQRVFSLDGSPILSLLSHPQLWNKSLQSIEVTTVEESVP